MAFPVKNNNKGKEKHMHVMFPPERKETLLINAAGLLT